MWNILMGLFLALWLTPAWAWDKPDYPLSPIVQEYFDKVSVASDRRREIEKLGWFRLFEGGVVVPEKSDYDVNVMAHYPDVVMVYTASSSRYPEDAAMLPISLAELGYTIYKERKGLRLNEHDLIKHAGGYVLMGSTNKPAPLQNGKRVDYYYDFHADRRGDCHLIYPQRYGRFWQDATVFAASRPEGIHKDRRGNFLWPKQESRDIRLAWLVRPQTGQIRFIDPRDVVCAYLEEDASEDLD
ncbi:MAG: hypothetical protein ACYCZC_00095 [Acidithiobacillus sp.]